MAIFSSSGVVGSVSGNAGGVNFVNGKGSKVIRKARRAGSINDNKIIKQQSVFATFARHWRTLSVDEQNAWRTYAFNSPRTNRLGLARQLSGFQEYMSSGIYRKGVLGFFNDLPPTELTDPKTAFYKFTSTVLTGISISMGSGPISGDISISLFGFLSYSTSLVASFNRHKYIGDFTIAQGAVLDITSEWEDVFPLPVLNQVIGFRGIFYNGGSPSRNANFQITKTVQGTPSIAQEDWSPTAVTGTATGTAANVNMERGSPGQDAFVVAYTDAETKNYLTFDIADGTTEMDAGSIITRIDMRLRGDTGKNDEFYYSIFINLGAGLIQIGSTKVYSDSTSGIQLQDINFSDASWQGLSWTKAQWDTIELRSLYSEGQGGDGAMSVINILVTFDV